MPDDLFSRVLTGASFEGVDFHVESERGEFGHDGIEHKAYRRPGSDIEPTGWRARRGTLACLFFNDIEPNLFPERYQRLVATIKQKPLGQLTHPVDGLMTAFLKTGHRATTAQERSGIRLELEWVEHNDTASSVLTFSSAATIDAPTATTNQASVADDAMISAAPSGGFTPVSPVISEQLNTLESAALTVSQIEASLRIMQSVVDDNIHSTVFSSIAGYDAILALESLASTIGQLRARYLPDASRLRQYTVPVTMSAWSVSEQVYGDAGHSDLIMRANSIPDALFIPAGSRLVILPID